MISIRHWKARMGSSILEAMNYILATRLYLSLMGWSGTVRWERLCGVTVASPGLESGGSSTSLRHSRRYFSTAWVMCVEKSSVTKQPIVTAATQPTFVPFSTMYLGGVIKGLLAMFRPVRCLRWPSWGGRSVSWFPSSRSVRKYLNISSEWFSRGSARRVKGHTNLSFSMDEGIDTSLLFLRSSHLKLGQLWNRESGNAFSLLPSR